MNEYGISRFAQTPSVTRSRATAMFCIAKLVAALRLTSRREALVCRCAIGFGSAVGFGWALFLRVAEDVDPYKVGATIGRPFRVVSGGASPSPTEVGKGDWYSVR